MSREAPKTALRGPAKGYLWLIRNTGFLLPFGLGPLLTHFVIGNVLFRAARAGVGQAN